MSKEYFLSEVKDKKSAEEFRNFSAQLYKNDKHWVRPLNIEIEKIFTPDKNKFFRTGDAIRWIVYNNQNRPVARMATFYEKNTANKNEQPTGGVGFFDCIDNQQVANILFDSAKSWLIERGMEAMDGPVNFGDRDMFWGCLVDGFYEPIYNMPYNFLYYNKLFTNYGFKDYFKQYTYHIKIAGGVRSQIIHEKAKRLHRDPGYRFDILQWKNINQYAEEFMIIFNKAWAKFPGVKLIKKAHAFALLNSLKSIIEQRAVLFGYYHDEPIAFFIMVPDLNPIIRNFNGKLHWFNKLRLFFRLKILKNNTRLIGLIFGVVPEHQGKGVESGIIMRFEQEAFKGNFSYTDLEMNWIGDFNPSMMKLAEQIGGKIRKTHITYRYLFDRTKEFKRATKLN